jgi:hypothetical protein
MSTPKDVTYVRGYKDTADTISSEKEIAIGRQIWMYDPNTNQALRSALRSGTTEDTPNHVFYDLHDAPFANWVEYAGAVESTQAATGVVLASGHGARVTTGSRIYWPRIEEVIRLDAAMSTDTTAGVSRNFGRGNASTSLLRPGDKGLIIAPSFEQGFTMGSGLANAMVVKTRYTSIVSWPVQVTDTEDAEIARAGNPFKRALKKAIKQSKDQMEGELLLSGYKVDSSTYTHPLTTSEGLANLIATNVYSVGSISRMDLWDIFAEWSGRRFGGSVWCSSPFYAMATMWAMQHLTIDQSSVVDGMSVEAVLTPYGRFELSLVDLLDQDPYLAGQVFLVPNKHIVYRPLNGYKNLDVKYRPVSRDEIHSKEGEIYGEYGWGYGPEEDFARITGLRFTA